MDTLQSFSGEKPTHIAVIMDGNGRWANARGLPRTAGHRQGAESVRRTVEATMKLGIPYLTLYGFSSENWNRPMAEVEDLMGLLRRYLRSELAKFHENGIRLQVIGQRERLPEDIVRLIEDAEATTQDNDKLNLVIALSYGGRQDITMAARRAVQAVSAGELKPEDLDEAKLGSFLWTNGIPDPDLLIRTSGEQRISNFLLWQSAYSEMVFVEKLWPDFGADDLADAIREYQRRDRRFGAAADSG